MIWQWTDKNTESLNKIKNLISEASILNNFDINKQIVLQCDSSQNALGCCLLQDNKPVAFASKPLTSTESKYAQIEKELLSVTFALSKFHNYIYGSKIIVNNDHLPLVSLSIQHYVKYIRITSVSDEEDNQPIANCLSALIFKSAIKQVPWTEIRSFNFLTSMCSR